MMGTATATEIDVWDYLTILKAMRYYRTVIYRLTEHQTLFEYTLKELHEAIDKILEAK